jgi:hypothetical protein
MRLARSRAKCANLAWRAAKIPALLYKELQTPWHQISQCPARPVLAVYRVCSG